MVLGVLILKHFRVHYNLIFGGLLDVNMFVPAFLQTQHIHRGTFKGYGYTSMFSSNFTKGDNFFDFLFAFLDNAALST